MKRHTLGLALLILLVALFLYVMFSNTKEYMTNGGLVGPNISSSVEQANEYNKQYGPIPNSEFDPNEIVWKEKHGVNKLDLHASYPGGPVPLPEGELLMFNDNIISPACCGSATYSSSSGCICTSQKQLDYINQRGGNRPSGSF